MKEMTPRERYVAASNHRPVDRLPLDMTFSIGAYNSLARYLGDLPVISECGTNCNVYPDVSFYKKMGIDVMYLLIGSPSTVTPFHYGDDSFTTEFGFIYKKIVLPNGELDYEISNVPMKGFEIEDWEAFPWPDPEDPQIHATLKERAKAVMEQEDMALGGYFNASIFTMPSLMIGMEEFLYRLAAEEEYAYYIMNRFTDYYIRLYNRALDECGQYLTFLRIDMDDFGTQNGVFISREMFNRLVRPYEERLCSEVKKHFLKYNPEGLIMKHTCGDVTELLPDFAGMTIDVLNPIQARTRSMRRELVYEKAGGKLAFMGAIDTQHIMVRGTVRDVYEDVRDAIAKLAPDGTGYIIGPSHHLQSDIPPENMLAMRDAAHRYGRIVNGRPCI